MTKKITIMILLLIVGITTLKAQTYFEETIISETADGAYSVFAADIDDDGFIDAISASLNSDRIDWYKNNGDGTFGQPIEVTNLTNGALSIFAADFNGDNKIDIVSASNADHKIAWYENDGTGNFGTQQIISSQAMAAKFVYAADVNKDGYIDVLSASYNDDKIAWYQNDGLGNFSSEKVIRESSSDGSRCVFVADLNGDTHMDVLYASMYADKIAWFQNDGSQNFSSEKIITSDASNAMSVFAADLDNDNDIDVLSASYDDDKIAWYENDGAGNFSSAKIISNTSDGAMSVYAIDLNNDNYIDVISTSLLDNTVAWFENLGDGSFGEKQIITTSVDGPTFAYSADLNNDGDNDILSSSQYDDKIAWYENFTLKITEQPQNVEFCVNSTANITVIAVNTNNYQWQVNEGSGFNNINDNETYTGTQTNSLEIANLNSNMSGNTFQCILSNAGGNQLSEIATLTIETELPTINCINNQTVNANETNVYVVQENEFDPTETSDNCEITSVENDFNNTATLENAQLPEGITTVTWIIVDNAGNTNTCSFDVTVNAFVGIETLQQKGISIYPNPTNGIINFEFADKNIQKITISDITGKQIIEKLKIKQNEQIDLSYFESGIYIIKIQKDNEIFTTKIIKK